MKHYGDITRIKGNEVPMVDIITGGSPCQDLSVAGLRKGLLHSDLGDGETTRSGLFMEQIRIIKEMRDESRRRLGEHGRTDVDIRLLKPRYMVWENVQGALNSGVPKGEDFRIVLEETAKIADKDAVIPRPADGKWSYSGCIVGDRWSIAWRTHDAQFWGVPQRRKRICLVADFNGDTAGKILFDVQLRGEAEYAEAFQTVRGAGNESRPEVQPFSESLSRDSEQGKPKGESTPADTERSVGASSYTLKIRGGAEVDSYGKKAGKGALIQTELSATLGVSQDQTLITGISDEDVISSDGDVAGTLDASYYKGCGTRRGRERTFVLDEQVGADIYNGSITGDVAATLNATSGGSGTHSGPNVVCLEGNGSRESHKGDGYTESETMYTLNTVEQHAVCIGNGQVDQLYESDKVGALNCMHEQQAVITFSDVQNALNYRDGRSGVHTQMLDQPENNFVLTYGLDRASFNQGQNAKYDFAVEEELAQPIVARGPGGVLTKQ